MILRANSNVRLPRGLKQSIGVSRDVKKGKRPGRVRDRALVLARRCYERAGDRGLVFKEELKTGQTKGPSSAASRRPTAIWSWSNQVDFLGLHELRVDHK